jgi:hypothetical protein
MTLVMTEITDKVSQECCCEVGLQSKFVAIGADRRVSAIVEFGKVA